MLIEEKAYRYVIYVRKSVDETGKEEKSVDQQLKYCNELAEREELNVVKIVKEEHSAKKSGAREKFNKILDDIERGIYDGIIAWHPDRLARNMGDGGRIIEMIDNHIISDLKFCTQQFSKDANGKMLLGLSFVLSKQYSDKLSQDVLRGNKEKHLAGKAIGRVKNGYKIGENGRYIKDENWGLIRKAWKMRLEGEQQVKICDWLNQNGYEKVVNSTNSKQRMDTSKLSRIFKDPIYYGYSFLNDEHPVYLPTLYDFPVMITEDEFIKVQRTSRIFEGTKQKEDYWLRGKVWDSEFEGIEYKPGLVRNKAKNLFLYYNVDSTHKKRVPNESRKNLRSVRAKTILEALMGIFSKMRTDYSQEEYNAFLDAAKQYMDERSVEIANETRIARQCRTKAQNELRSLALGYMKSDETEKKKQKKLYESETKRLEKEIEEYKNGIQALEQEDENLFPVFKSFSNTMKNLSQSYFELEPEAMFEIAEIMVSNIFVHKGKVVVVQFKPPFDSLFNDDISSGWLCECTFKHFIKYYNSQRNSSKLIEKFCWDIECIVKKTHSKKVKAKF